MCNNHTRYIYGVDFSGSQTAGDKIWICEVTAKGRELVIEDCYPAKDLPGGSRRRDEALTALRRFIENRNECAFGLDFPFGLPETVVPDYPDWETFVQEFSDRYDGPNDLHHSCKSQGAALSGDDVEYRRKTDNQANAPFCPYNWRIRHQTYYGIADLLAPLVENGTARIRPMQEATENAPSVMEVCPSSTLQRRQLPHTGYKGKGPEAMRTREQILDALDEEGLIIPDEVYRMAIRDGEGDAVDSIVAALATGSAVHDKASGDNVGIEGYIYV